MMIRTMAWITAGAVMMGCGAGAHNDTPPGETTPSNAALPALDYTKPVTGVSDIDGAVAEVKAALSAQGFGVVSDMDIQATMKQKIGKEMRPYRILGVCNPELAYQALEADKTLGLLLPCKAVVYQNDAGDFIVSLAQPKTVFTLRQNSAVASIAAEVDGLIRAAFDAIH